MPNPTTNKNTVPSSLHGLTIHELFLFTRIPLHLLDGFVNGKFKPNPVDREKLTKASLPFYKWNAQERELYVARRKYRELRGLISVEEKARLLDKPNQPAYDRELNRLLEKYWEEIVAVPIKQEED